ncbi:MAG: GNAT family N-acetyltransferase [Oscillospiraceae bacterium]|nr:GNAT family N-acetyltransferase [Oscillospiraceae bacterium]
MIREVADKDVPRAIDLVNRVFTEFVAVDYSKQGRNTFETYLKTKLDDVSAALKSGGKKMWAYYQDDDILGVLAIQGPSHISLMFVEKAHHRQGIAKGLFDVALGEMAQNRDVTQITVNSSPYAVEAYERLGFAQTAEQQEKDGILYVPMRRTI